MELKCKFIYYYYYYCTLALLTTTQKRYKCQTSIKFQRKNFNEIIKKSCYPVSGCWYNCSEGLNAKCLIQIKLRQKVNPNCCRKVRDFESMLSKSTHFSSKMRWFQKKSAWILRAWSRNRTLFYNTQSQSA